MESEPFNFLQSLEFQGQHDFLEPKKNQFEAWNETEFCSGPDYLKFRVMEFGVKSVPALLFFILGTWRWMQIRDIGVGNTTYSTHFKAKLVISMLMAVADFIYIIIVLAMPASVEHSSWINQCGQDVYTVVYAF